MPALLKVYLGTTELANGNPASAMVHEIRDAIAGTRLVQDEQLIRGTQPTFFDRLANRNTFTITIRKQVTDYRRGLHLALTGRQNTPGTGALTIELVDGATTHQWRAARAKWSEMTSRPAGASLLVTYRVETGTFSYSSSDDEDWAGDILGGRDVSVAPAVAAVGGRHIVHTPSATIYGGRTIS